MRLHVDAWDPAYGSAVQEGGPGAASAAELDLDVELNADDWRPIAAPPGLAPPPVVTLVDGVRRIDASIWLTDDSPFDGAAHPGVAASYAAGAVRCDLVRGAAELAVADVERGLFTTAPDAPTVTAGSVTYIARQVSRGEPSDLSNAVQGHLSALEARVAARARAARPAVPDGDGLLVVDGHLKGRAHLPNTLGYVKTHRVEYLPARLSTVVGQLAAGERCPVFRLATSWRRHSWYLRLPGPPGAPWAGVVRVECAAELPREEVLALADLSAATLPRFASSAYKDPRAPQNLVPIAGLERRLRALLGDGRLLHRVLLRAASATAARV